MCGVVVIRGVKGAYNLALSALMNLQHRGQDGAGILTVNQNKGFQLKREPGLISNSFQPLLKNQTADAIILNDTVALGHTRYSTVGSNDPNLLQPFIHKGAGLALAHNGNLVNFYDLKKQWVNDYETKEPVSDSSMLLNLLAQKLLAQNAPSFFNAVDFVMHECIGGYAIVGVLDNGAIFGFRDPNGIRPLVLGVKTDNESVYGMASESLPLSFLGFDRFTDIKPGQAIYIDEFGQKHEKIIKESTVSPCMFEWVYFARVESTINDRAIYQARFDLGVNLAKAIQEKQITADVVCCVPETSRISALALAQTLDIPYRELLIKNRYINRTFILDSGTARAEAIEYKLFPIQSEIKDKTCIIVDDSIVRGTTAAQIVRILRKCGVKKVIFASTCPPIISPCYYGLDFPDSKELISYQKTDQEIARDLGANEVVFQSLHGLESSLKQKHLCTGCISGSYPTSIESATNFTNTRKNDRKVNEKIL